MQSIGNGSFSGTKIQNVDLSSANQLTSIGNRAFIGTSGNITNVNTLKLPTSLQTIGNGAFKYAEISSLDLSNLNNLRIIGDGAFAENTSLNDLKFPTSGTLIDIQDGAFYKTTSLQSVTLPTSGITEIKRGVFAESGLQSLDLSNTSITVIGGHAFYKSKLQNLEKNKLSKVETINENAFAEITTLASAQLPDSLTRLGPNAFSSTNNANFTSIDLSNTKLSHLDNQTFSDTSITTVTLPKTLRTLGNNVFAASASAQPSVTNVI